MKRLLVATTVFGCLAITAACGGTEREIDGYNETGYEVSQLMDREGYGDWGNIDAFDARIQGDIGNLAGIDGDAVVAGYSEDRYADLEVTTVGANGSAMHMLTINGGLNHAAMVPGAHLEFTGDGYADTNANDLHVMSMNCSGSGQPGDWEYDEPADRVALDISSTEDEDVIRVDYTTEKAEYGLMGGDNHISSGTFLLRR